MRYLQLLMSRHPLHLVEASGDSLKKARDLGYHHAIRGKPFDPSGAVDKEAYKAGYQRGKLGGSQSATASGPSTGGVLSTTGPEQPPVRDGGGFKTVLPHEPIVHGPASGPGDPSSLGSPERHGVFGQWLRHANENPAYKKALKQSLQSAASRAVDRLRGAGHKLGDRLGCGMNGCAYQSGEAGKIYKLDKGENEARLASLIMDDPDLQGLTGVPRYDGVYNTGITDKLTEMPLYAIKREDIQDVHPSFNSRILDHLGSSLQELSGNVKKRGLSKESLIKAADKIVSNYERMLEKSPNYGDRESRGLRGVLDTVKALAKKGIAPCDLHSDNWGQRSNGEIVMRDMGCYTLAGKGGDQPSKLPIRRSSTGDIAIGSKLSSPRSRPSGTGLSRLRSADVFTSGKSYSI